MNNRYSTVQRPEAALQRANDFISVGKEADALNALYEVIKDRRQRQWSETYEEIMLKHVELCVKLRNTALAKDGMFQYRVFTQQVSVTSLKKVIDHFLSLAEQKTEEAQKESVERVEEIDDLDNADAPENLLLSVVSGAVTQDRMDRTVLAPWLRFLWDSYRNCLDMLRNNALVEEIYHQVARLSFAFCAKYQRRNEFRKLCELLRLHLAQIQKSQLSTEFRNNDFRVKLTSSESLQHMLETRLIQLNTAIEMELWQEAYKSAEDLHNMMQLSEEKDRRMVKPSSYVNYYDKLALIFWKGGNTLFHAAALLQKYSTCKDMKKSFTDDEAQDQATRVLLAALTIQDGAEQPSTLTKLLDIEDQQLANVRVLSSLLRLPIAPTRAGLLKQITWLNIPEMAVEPARAIFRKMELDFQPLRLASTVQKHMDAIDLLERPDYSQYFHKLKYVVATKVLRQLSVIYGSLSLERFQRIIPYFNRIELEHFLVDAAKHNNIKASVSHRGNSVVFSALDLTLAGGLDASGDVEAASNGIEYIREHLIQLHQQLQNAVFQLDGQTVAEDVSAKLQNQIKTYLFHREEDYARVMLRGRKIEDYKEISERQRNEKIQLAQEEQQKREEQRRQEELKRLAEENKENERKRQQAEKDEIIRRQKAEQLKRFQSNPIYQQIVKEKGEDVVQTMDPELVLKEQRERMDVERREMQNKLRVQEKKFDYVVRAFHIEEIKCYEELSQQYTETAPERFAESEERRVQQAVTDHERGIQTYERVNKLRADAEKFLKDVVATKTEDLERRRREWRQRIEDERKRRLLDRKEQRKVERQRKAEREKREAKEQAREKAVREEMERQEQSRAEHRQMMQRLHEKERAAQGMGSMMRRGPLGESRIGDRNAPSDGGSGKYVAPRPRDGAADVGAFRRHPRDDGPSAHAENWRRGPPAQSSPVPPAAQQQEQLPPSKPDAWVPQHRRNQNAGAPTPPSADGPYRPPARRREPMGRADQNTNWRS